MRTTLTETKKRKRYHFRTREEFNQGTREFYNLGWYESGNGNPPTGNEPGTYSTDEAWLFIDIIKGDTDLSFGRLEYVTPPTYFVHNHGGHLD